MGSGGKSLQQSGKKEAASAEIGQPDAAGSAAVEITALILLFPLCLRMNYVLLALSLIPSDSLMDYKALSSEEKKEEESASGETGYKHSSLESCLKERRWKDETRDSSRAVHGAERTVFMMEKRSRGRG